MVPPSKLGQFLYLNEAVASGRKKYSMFKLAATASFIINFLLTTENFSEVCGKNENVSWLIEYLSIVSLDDLSETDANIVVFVSGYFGRSVSRSRSCFSCKQLLVASEDTLQIQDCVPEEHRKLFDIANRGGLSMPTEICFTVTSLAVQCCNAIEADESIKKRLLAMNNQRGGFLHAVSCVAKQSNFIRVLLDIKCSVGHRNFDSIIKCAFNCLAKNELKRLNAPKLEVPAKMSRTVRKTNQQQHKLIIEVT